MVPNDHRRSERIEACAIGIALPEKPMKYVLVNGHRSISRPGEDAGQVHSSTASHGEIPARKVTTGGLTFPAEASLCRETMQHDDLDAQAKYKCDALARTLPKKGLKLERDGDHALRLDHPCKPFGWRIVVCRSGDICLEPLDGFSGQNPIPHLKEYIADAFAEEFTFTVRTVGARIEMTPHALPPVSTLHAEGAASSLAAVGE